MSIILGRPFLAIAPAITHSEKVLVLQSMRKENAKLNCSRLMKYPCSSHEDVGTQVLIEDNDDLMKSFLKICGVEKLENLEELANSILSLDIAFKTLPSFLKYALLVLKETS